MLRKRKEQLEVIARIPLDKRALSLLSYLIENSKDGMEVQILARPGSNPVAYQRTLSEKIGG